MGAHKPDLMTVLIIIVVVGVLSSTAANAFEPNKLDAYDFSSASAICSLSGFNACDTAIRSALNVNVNTSDKYLKLTDNFKGNNVASGKKGCFVKTYLASTSRFDISLFQHVSVNVAIELENQQFGLSNLKLGYNHCW